MATVVDTEIYGGEIQFHIPWWVTAIFVVAFVAAVLFLVLLLTRKRR